MTLAIEPVHDDFVAVASSVDLTRPLSAADVRAVHQAMDRFGVLIFHDQPIDDARHLAFSKQLGALQPAVGNNVTPLAERRLGTDFSDVSNVDKANRVLDRYDRGRLFGFGNQLWHSDASFRANPAKYSILRAVSVASRGGNTEFADMRAAYDALDDEMKARIEGLVAEHSQIYSRGLLGFTEFTDAERETFAPVRQALVRTLASTGRRSLYVGSHAGAIAGWPVPEARLLIFDLIEHATQPAFVHVHRWRVHDVVIWDNRQIVHRVRSYDDLHEARDMRRTTIMGDGPTVPHRRQS